MLKYLPWALLLLSTVAQGQYFNFTQFDQTSLRVNPAYAVASDNEQANAIYRNQNTAADFNINSSSFSYQRPLRFKKSERHALGFGINALNDRSGGMALLSNQHLGLSLGTNVNLSEDQILNIGFSSTIKRMKFSLDGLTTGAQYDVFKGFDPTAFIEEDFSKQSITTIGVNAGILWQKKNEAGDQIAHLGWAIYDLNRPHEFIKGAKNNALPNTNIIQLGLRAFEKSNLSIYPQVLVLASGEIININAGIIWEYQLPEGKRVSKIALHTNYVVGSYGSLGFRLQSNKYSAGLSYDLGFENIQVANTGAIEISFAYHKMVRERVKPAELIEAEEEKQKLAELEKINPTEEEISPPISNIDTASIAKTPEVKLDELEETPLDTINSEKEIVIENMEKDAAGEVRREEAEKLKDEKSEITMLPEYSPNTSSGELVYSNVRMEKISIVCEFDFNKAILKEEVSEYLEALVDRMEGENIIAIEIIGHTDALGSEHYNMKLSTKRAHAIADFLATQGIAWSKMSVAGKGESQPLLEDGSDEGNRRVEVLIFSQQ